MRKAPSYMPQIAVRGIKNMVRGERYIQINLNYGVIERFVYCGHLGSLPGFPIPKDQWYYMRHTGDGMEHVFNHHSYGDHGIAPYSGENWNDTNFTIKESDMRKKEIKTILARIQRSKHK